MVNYSQNQYLTYGQMNLINDFRALWGDLVFFLRGYVLSTIAGLDKLTEATSKRLYHIPEDFRIKLQPFFGVEAAEQFAQLLTMFIAHSQTLITAQLRQDQKTVDEALINLYNTITDMADFLTRINPYWNKGQWQNLLSRTIELGMAELTALAAEDYERDLQLIDTLITQTTIMGDYMASGVIRYLTPGDM